MQLSLEWGLSGALALLERGIQLAVVVDILSFSTAVSVAADRGVEVFPFRWKDERATAFATAVGAELARGRRHGGVSLSPSSIRVAADLTRLVLPSPNGATIALTLAERGVTVLAGCLRNAAAVAGWLTDHADRLQPVGVIAAGERWPDGSLRPAIEDYWGAGAVLAGLDPATQTVEARAAAATFSWLENEIQPNLISCLSGQELVGYGFAGDVEIAAELNRSSRVPVLVDGAFRRYG